MAKRSRWVPQRSEAFRQKLIEELRAHRRMAVRARQREKVDEVFVRHLERRQLDLESVLRLDWDHGWPTGEPAPDPLPLLPLSLLPDPGAVEGGTDAWGEPTPAHMKRRKSDSPS